MLNIPPFENDRMSYPIRSSMVTLDNSFQDSCCLSLLIDGLFRRVFGSQSY